MNIVLYEPQIPPNTGNIGRLCVGTNSTLHLIGPMGFSIQDKDLKRAGLDYWKDLNYFYYENVDHFFDDQKDQRFFFFSKKGTTPYTKIKFQKNDFLVFGSETSGLPENLMQKYQDQIYTIPMSGPIRSLNLASAASIILYEALRQTENWT